jgi:CHAT domain-containing protein
MKKVFILFLFINSISLFAQSLTKLQVSFWESVNQSRNELIVKKGERLIVYYEEKEISIDTSFLLVRLFTANSYFKLGNYSRSLELNLESKNIYEKLNEINNPDYATCLNNIALGYSQIGDIELSLEYNLKVLLIREKNLGINSFDYAKSINNMALNYLDLGEYNKALEYSLIALKIKEGLFGKDHINCLISLNNVALVFSKLGEFRKSLEINLNVLKIKEKTYGKQHLLYALSLSNIAVNYMNLGQYEDALHYNLLAINIRENLLGLNHPLYAESLNNLAANYSYLGDHMKSMEYNLLALQFREKKFGKEDPNYAESLLNISIELYNLGDYKKSLDYNFLAYNIQEKALGTNHLDIAKCLNIIALNYLRLNEIDKSIEYLSKSLNIALESYLKNKFGLTASAKQNLKHCIEIYTIELASITCAKGFNFSSLYDYWITMNGIISSDENQLNKQIHFSNDTTIIQLYKDLKTVQILINKHQELSPSLKQEKNSEFKILTDRCRDLQIELSKRSQEFENLDRTITSLSIVELLNQNEIFLDIMIFPGYNLNLNNFTDSLKYLVFISSFQDTIVDYVLIEDGTAIDKDLFEKYKQEATDSEKKTDLTSEKFYNAFWKPIADKIGDAKTVYVSLGGVYNNINLNTIYNPTTGKYLLEEKDIRIVNSAREFILNKERETKTYTNNTASLFGFPNFDGNTTVSADTSDLFASTRDLNSFWLDSLTRGGLKAKPLPATKTEVENISSTLKSNGWQVKSYLADNASETNLKTQQSPRVLHVATHGYFFPDIPMEDKDQTRFLGMDRQQVVQDPMLRSGLLLTGANRTLKGESSTGENGLLSAAEASLLDLRETELVVLSACETGKGEVKNSEGVYGLRKAFSDAGAQNIIMSLWKVDDKVTQEFMSRFYEIWLNDKTSIREAFNRTQLEIKAKYPQPYYWGAFILVGE